MIELTKKQENQIIKDIINNIRCCRKGELYDEEIDPYEATDNYFSDLLSDIYYKVDLEIQKYIDEDYNII